MCLLLNIEHLIKFLESQILVSHHGTCHSMLEEDWGRRRKKKEKPRGKFWQEVKYAKLYSDLLRLIREREPFISLDSHQLGLEFCIPQPPWETSCSIKMKHVVVEMINFIFRCMYLSVCVCVEQAETFHIEKFFLTVIIFHHALCINNKLCVWKNICSCVHVSFYLYDVCMMGQFTSNKK